MSVCPHCGLNFLNEPAAGGAAPATVCPNCGEPLSSPTLSAPRSESPLDPIRNYFRDLWSIITNPTRFFRKMPVEGGLGHPLAFALVTHWLGSALSFLWHGLLGRGLASYFDSVFNILSDFIEVDDPGQTELLFQTRDQVTHWVWGAGSVIIDPFITLFAILFTALWVFVGARLLVTPGVRGAPARITFESALRIVCFGMSPSILAGVPFVGSFVAAVATALVTIVGAREVYRIGTGRAVLVALFPKMLFMGLFLLGFLAMFFVLMKFALSFFMA